MAEREAAEVFPPQAYIRDEMESRSWSVADLAEQAGWTRAFTSEVLQWRRVTPLVAACLAQAFGTSTTVWLNLQRAWDQRPAEARGEGEA